MSDENNSDASSAQHTIPKARLDEVLADKRRLEEQVNFQQQTLSQLIAQNQRANRPVEAESPEMQQLKAENPAAYNAFKRQQRELKEVRAATFNLTDELDRNKFLAKAGTAGERRAQEVEKILDHERRVNGNFRVDRLGIFQWLEGQDRLRKEQEVAKAPPPAAPVQRAQTEESEEYVPSSNPRLATTVAGGTAPARTVEKTREERMAELEDVIF